MTIHFSPCVSKALTCGVCFLFFISNRFQIDKRCQHRCSWKCFSIALILLAVALTAMLAYFAGELIKVLSFTFLLIVTS